MDSAWMIEPVAYHAFEDEEEQIEKCKEWGLLSAKAVKLKTFYYKGRGMNAPCSIIGYADQLTAVIAFDNEQKHCIHPSFLKEMQASSYEQKPVAAEELLPAEVEPKSVESKLAEPEAASPVAQSRVEATQPGVEVTHPPVEVSESHVEAVPAQPKVPVKKIKQPKLELPEGKVKMTATVQEFTTVPNHFSDTDDEVIIYEAVSILEPAMEVGTAWSSHSATLKKLELEVGDTLHFEAKVAAKKLTKHPVAYKINNPSKLQKGQN